MLRSKLFLVIAVMGILGLPSLSMKALAWYCAFEDTSYVSLCPYVRPSIDTTRTFVIYCCDSSVHNTLPSYYNQVWQMGNRSVPQFLWDNSMMKYSLSCDVISRGQYPIRNPYLDSDGGFCTGGGIDFATGIFRIADSTTNFALYDEDYDGIVDGFFFVILYKYPQVHGCPCLGDFSYKTNDTTATGDTVWVLGERGVEVSRPAGDVSQSQFVHICVHEWGHQFGLVDLHRC